MHTEKNYVNQITASLRVVVYWSWYWNNAVDVCTNKATSTGIGTCAGTSNGISIGIGSVTIIGTYWHRFPQWYPMLVVVLVMVLVKDWNV